MTEPKNNTQTDVVCRLVKQWLPGYLRHELTAVQRRQVQAHLAECDSCAQLVQEARLLDAELQTEANYYQPRLSNEASLRIQNQVYRQMQRSLAWQRTGQVARLGMTFAALVVLLLGSFTFGRFWLSFLANPPGETLTGESIITEEVPQPAPTAVPTAPPLIPTPAPVERIESPSNSDRTNAWDHWEPVFVGQSPEQLAETIMHTALTEDEALLTDLFVGMGAAGSPAARLWLRLGERCIHRPAASDFDFIRLQIPLPNITTVSIWYADHMVGELKMRRIAGEWFATFTRVPAINPCLLS